MTIFKNRSLLSWTYWTSLIRKHKVIIILGAITLVLLIGLVLDFLKDRNKYNFESVKKTVSKNYRARQKAPKINQQTVRKNVPGPPGPKAGAIPPKNSKLYSIWMYIVLSFKKIFLTIFQGLKKLIDQVSPFMKFRVPKLEL